MTSNELENKLHNILDNEDFVVQYIFNEIERSECKGKYLSNDFFDKLKLRLIGNYMNGVKLLDEPAQIPYLKECVIQFSKDYDFILEDCIRNFDVQPFQFLKKNVVAALEEEIRRPEENKANKPLTKIKVKCEKVLLYAAFREIAKELFIDATDHRLSQLISDNFTGEDGSPIDQKTCYNQLKTGYAPKNSEKLHVVFQNISRRIK